MLPTWQTPRLVWLTALQCLKLISFFFGDMQKLWVIVRLPFWPLGEDLMSCRSTKMAVPIGFAMGEWKVV
jgi:hypothetical protein